jgi:hypothetical protein
VRGRKNVSLLPPTCFAVATKQVYPDHQDGWKVFSPSAEYHRQGMTGDVR